MNTFDVKRKIQQRFNQASASYDVVATVQKTCAETLTAMLIDQCPDFYPSTVLDLGTGTGYMPQLLLRHFPKSRFTLNDLAPDMLACTQKKLGLAVQYQLGDMETTAFDYHDLIVSNLALQWMNDLEATLRALHFNSHTMAFSCLLDGTFQEWANLLKQQDVSTPLLSYPSQPSLESFILSLNTHHHAFEIREFQMTFSGARSFMRYLKQLGASVSQANIPFSHLKHLVQMHQKTFDVTYRVFFCIVSR